MKTLCVIDVQKDFVPHTSDFSEKVINNCITLIQRYKKLELPIIFVEYVGFGSTVENLKFVVKGYNQFYTIKKTEMSGGRKIVNLINKHNLPTDLEFCGVNWHQCVSATIYDIINSGNNFNISAYSNASNPYSYTDQNFYWVDMKKLVKIKYVKRRKNENVL